MQKNFKIEKKIAEKIGENLILKKNLRTFFFAKNCGYSAGNNFLATRARGEFLAILNPDIFLPEKNSLQKILDFLEKNPEIGILGPAQFSEKNGRRESTARRFPRISTQIARRTFLRKIPFFRKKIAADKYENLDFSATQNVDWLQSSCIFLRKNFFFECGGFDEKFFLFLADTALCAAAKNRGKKIIFFPAAKIFGDGIRCSRGGAFDFFRQKNLRIHFFDALKFFFRRKKF